MAGYCWKLLEMAGMDRKNWKGLKMAGNCWKWLESAGNGKKKWLDWLEMA